ncbi:hypothetical protein C6P45_002090 [Maudiozyma exigua]|uniref:Phosphatidylinositol N-acetylglucosaminyltransferase subunit H conserved domain-containing protein n=1 Tax=Maudiozyma exigua TaxID=34358 RepID=A0A9P6W047_MAUEX|nr:hypothetical protein C6P45_002090 [Kazachstania exigua]
MVQTDLSTTFSEERKKYTIEIEREQNDNYIRITIIPNGLRKKQLINCVLIIFFNAWISMARYNPYFEKFGRYSLLARLLILFTSCRILKNPTVETLMIFKNYGIQTLETSGYSILPNSINKRICTPESVFVPRDAIVDIIINEAFVKECQVIFYLAVIVKGEDKLKLLFAKSRPRLVDQKVIYNLSRNCLYPKNGSDPVEPTVIV